MMVEYAFTPSELEYMRSVQEGHMMDICVFQTQSYTANSFNEQVESWVDATSSICGLDMKSGSERRGVDNILVQYDAVLRLPITTVVDEKDKIKVTHRFGELLTIPLIYEIVSPIQRGASGIRILLKRIEL